MLEQIKTDMKRYRQDIVSGAISVEAINEESKLPCLRLGFLNSTYELVGEWVTEVKRYRYERDAIRDDNGPDRRKQEIVGKLAEVACVILQDKMPLAVARGGFKTDFALYRKGHVAFTADLAEGVGVKTYVDDHQMSWIIDRNDPMGISPSPQDAMILCDAIYCENSHYTYYIDIIGYVMAKEIVDKGLWFPTRKLQHKKAMYLESGWVTSLNAFEANGMAHTIIEPTHPPLERNW